MSTKPTSRIPDTSRGCCFIIEFFVDFLVWADGKVPSAQAIASHLGVSRATSYRYHAALRRLHEKHGALKFERARG